MQVYTLGSTNGNYIFFEENPDRGMVFYSLVNQEGETLRKGQMSMSMVTFVDLLQRIGFTYIPKGELF